MLSVNYFLIFSFFLSLLLLDIPHNRRPYQPLYMQPCVRARSKDINFTIIIIIIIVIIIIVIGWLALKSLLCISSHSPFSVCRSENQSIISSCFQAWVDDASFLPHKVTLRFYFIFCSLGFVLTRRRLQRVRWPSAAVGERERERERESLWT
ncbi:hypothetical protein ACJBU6_04429 [Exserohilum turcicum]